MGAGLLTALGSDRLTVDGGKRALAGAVEVGGFKHSLVTVLAAAAVARAPLTIRNPPLVAETDRLLEFLGACGSSVATTPEGVRVDATALRPNPSATAALGAIHGGVYMLPGLLAKSGVASVPVGGGCRIGDDAARQRPVLQYVDVLRRFGAEDIRIADGLLEVRAGRLRGCDIDLLDYCAGRRLRTGPLYSGATKMALLMAVIATGTSRLSHLYPKADVLDLVEVLRRFGAGIDSAADGTLRIRGDGGRSLCTSSAYTLPADLIEVVTWICAGALLGAPALTVRGRGMDRALRGLAPELAVLAEMGVEPAAVPGGIEVRRAERLRPVFVTVSSHGVFSDSQPFLALLAGHAHGQSLLVETVWKQRFQYAEGLRRLGMQLRSADGQLAVIGRHPPHRAGQTVVATDLRAAAVLVVAAALIDGRTTVLGTAHLRRGYPDLPGTLRNLGANVAEG